MDNTQIWAVIAVFASIGIAMWSSIHTLRRDTKADMAKGFADVNARMDEKFGEQRSYIATRFASEREYNDLRFTGLEQRLGNVESDLTIIKGHLISQDQPLRLAVLAEAKHD